MNCLSVIIPVYNRQEMVLAAAVSVLHQELPPTWELELFIVDDGSDDGTNRAVSHFARDHKQVHLITMDHTGMAGAVRNRGVAASQGTLLAFLDSDDLWLPGKLLQQIPRHYPGNTGEGAEFSHTRERWVRHGAVVSQDSRRFRRYRRQGDMFRDALVKCIIGPSTVMMTRQLWNRTGGFREDLEIAEDYEYWLRITALCHVAYLEEELTVKQAGHQDQLSHRYGEIERFRLDGLMALTEACWFREHRGEAAQRDAERELARKALIYAKGAAKRGRQTEAERWMQIHRRFLTEPPERDMFGSA